MKLVKNNSHNVKIENNSHLSFQIILYCYLSKTSNFQNWNFSESSFKTPVHVPSPPEK